MRRLFLMLVCIISASSVVAAPLWTMTPVSGSLPVLSIPAGGTATVQYLVANQSSAATLTMTPIAGVTQNTATGNCPLVMNLAAKGQTGSTCLLSLAIQGGTVGTAISGGPQLCQGSQCYSASQPLRIAVTSGAVLTAQAPNLVLGTTGVITGSHPGTITVKNISANPIVISSVNFPTWPAGTSVTNNTCAGTIASNATCTITVTPGATPTPDMTGTACTSHYTAPVPGIVTVLAGNTSVQSKVVVLGYGCIYQGGYVFSLNAGTLATGGSAAGTVVALSDQAAQYPNGIIWSSNGYGSTLSYTVSDAIPGILESSTAGPGSCSGADDGACDTSTIVTYYSPAQTSPAVNLSYYAAGLCRATINGYDDWFLPAICQMGPNSNGSGCVANTPNIVTNLSAIIGYFNVTNPGNSCSIGTNCLAGPYWSSTENGLNTAGFSWAENFESGSSSQPIATKDFPYGVRCSRALTL